MLQNAPEAKLELPGIRIAEQILPETIAKFDLTFSVNEQVSGTGEPQGLRGYIEYSADLFDEADGGRARSKTGASAACGGGVTAGASCMSWRLLRGRTAAVAGRVQCASGTAVSSSNDADEAV